MGRIVKIFGIVVGAVIVLFVAVLVAVGMMFDPNDYKDEITAAVARSTGRELTLDGDLELAVFPTMRIARRRRLAQQRAGLRRPSRWRKIGSAELRLAAMSRCCPATWRSAQRGSKGSS